MAATVSSSVTVTGLPACLLSSVASLLSFNRFIHYEIAPFDRAAYPYFLQISTNIGKIYILC
jgi:hypothetical protein